MRNISEYIIERNSPDKIRVTDKNGNNVNFYYTSDEARPFLFDVEDNKPIFSIYTRSTHLDIIYQLLREDEGRWRKLGLDKAEHTTDVRYDPSVGSYEYWKKRHMETAKKLRSGRLWDVMWDDKPTLFIAWWDEMTSEEFINFNSALIKGYFDENFVEMKGSDMDDYAFYCIDNNGKVFEWNPKDKKEVKLAKRTKESQELIDAAYAIHNASQKEKKKFYANFKQTRDEKNQKICNHTKSKTEAEYRALKYQESKTKDLKTLVCEAEGEKKAHVFVQYLTEFSKEGDLKTKKQNLNDLVDNADLRKCEKFTAIDGSEFEENYIEENDLEYGFQWDDDFYDYCKEYFLDESGHRIKFNKNNCIYCERAIAVESNFDPKKYIDKYNGHLGVYWTYENGNADAVDGMEDNIIILRGYVKPEDCDWAETISSNLLDPDEMELTIKKDADILITNIQYNDEEIYTGNMICKT